MCACVGCFLCCFDLLCLRVLLACVCELDLLIVANDSFCCLCVGVCFVGCLWFVCYGGCN